MDVFKRLMKSVRSMNYGKLETDANLDYAGYGVFAAAVLYILYRGQLATIGLAIGVALILYVVTGGNMAISLIAGALSGLIAAYYSRRRMEGFADEATEAEGATESAEAEAETPAEGGAEDSAAGEDTTDAIVTTDEKEKKKPAAADGFADHDEEDDGMEEDEMTEGFMGYTPVPNYGSFNGRRLNEGFASPKPRRRKRAPAPDHGKRAEMFELGKKYKLPSEEDDSEFHLDAGTTFMNAYKSLKPDQIAAMTKDTQELMQTQKQLMSTLSTLKPLIQDGKEMMNMFQGYFGSGSPSST
jgi:hypothetical protein